jgi:hypothetical protein
MGALHAHSRKFSGYSKRRTPLVRAKENRSDCCFAEQVPYAYTALLKK